MRDEHELKPADSPGWMTVRDYYAMHAMKSLIAVYTDPRGISSAIVAAMAYKMADAMLAARTTKPEKL